MKKLDEVIWAVQNCDSAIDDCDNCPYYKEDCDNLRPLRTDVLKYLKAYRDDRDDLTALRAYWKEQQENPPLTWDELRTMEGKPVWLESHGDITEFTGWAIVSRALSDRAHFILSHYDDSFLTYEMALPDITFGRDWQIYRKERM